MTQYSNVMRLIARRRRQAGEPAGRRQRLRVGRNRSDEATWLRRPGDFVCIAQYFIAEDSATVRDNILSSITYFRKQYLYWAQAESAMQCSRIPRLHVQRHTILEARA